LYFDTVTKHRLLSRELLSVESFRMFSYSLKTRHVFSRKQTEHLCVSFIILKFEISIQSTRLHYFGGNEKIGHKQITTMQMMMK